jgi:hypothetical protein
VPFASSLWKLDRWAPPPSSGQSLTVYIQKNQVHWDHSWSRCTRKLFSITVIYTAPRLMSLLQNIPVLLISNGTWHDHTTIYTNKESRVFFDSSTTVYSWICTVFSWIENSILKSLLRLLSRSLCLYLSVSVACCVCWLKSLTVAWSLDFDMSTDWCSQ